MRDDEMILEAPAPWAVVQNYFYIEDVTVARFNPLPDTVLMCGIPVTLEADFLDSMVIWSTGERAKSIEVSSAGVYTAEISLEGCLFRDTTLVVDVSEWRSEDIKDTVCSGIPETLTAPVPGTYAWSTGDTSESIVVAFPGVYDLTVTNACDTYNFSFRMVEGECMCDIYVANTFSPNGDGVNDFLECNLRCEQGFEFTAFRIFNRWGQEVFTSSDPLFQWDGTTGSDKLEAGVYVWMLEYRTIEADGLRFEI